MEPRVNLLIRDGIAEVTLNRPEKLNALDFETFEQLAAIGEQLQRAQGVRVAVLSGQGRSFSVGIDLSSLVGGEAQILAWLEDVRGEQGNFLQRCALQWRALPFPVIAALQGHALGGGLQIALGADIRVVSPQAQLSLKEVVWGIIPDMAGTVLMRGLVRDDIARDLLFTGRIVSGTDALHMGLATRLADDPRTAALSIANEIACHSPHAVRAAKRLANNAANGAAPGLMLAAEAEEQKILISGSNHSEALAAHGAKRLPCFAD